MAVHLPKHISEEEYLVLERASDTRHEYFQGEMISMAGFSLRHSTIVGSAQAHLYGQLRGAPCRVYNSVLRLKVSAVGLYTYPDLVVFCGDHQSIDRHRDTLLNPTVLIEV